MHNNVYSLLYSKHYQHADVFYKLSSPVSLTAWDNQRGKLAYAQISNYVVYFSCLKFTMHNHQQYVKMFFLSPTGIIILHTHI